MALTTTPSQVLRKLANRRSSLPHLGEIGHRQVCYDFVAGHSRHVWVASLSGAAERADQSLLVNGTQRDGVVTVVAESLAWAVGELAERSTSEFDLDDMLRRLCEVAAESLEVDGVGLMKLLDGETRFVHVSNPELTDLERLQELLQTGPCRDAADSRLPVAAGTVAEMVWPEFERLAGDTGMHAVLAVPLLTRSRVWGTLDLYWRAEHPVTDTDRASAQLLANVAVSYLAMAQDRA